MIKWFWAARSGLRAVKAYDTSDQLDQVNADPMHGSKQQWQHKKFDQKNLTLNSDVSDKTKTYFVQDLMFKLEQGLFLGKYILKSAVWVNLFLEKIEVAFELLL